MPLLRMVLKPGKVLKEKVKASDFSAHVFDNLWLLVGVEASDFQCL
jgi:hypothetical protein